MNEQIQKFAEQANLFAMSQHPEQDSYGRPADQRKFQATRDVKFAELLLVQCTLIAEDLVFKYAQQVDTYAAGKKAGAFEVLTGINEQFGVK